MRLEGARAQRRHGTEGEEEVVVDDGVALGEMRGDVLELHGVGARRRPFQTDDVGHVGEALDQGERQACRGPEGIVDDDADLGGRGRALADEGLEISLAVLEIERAGDLDEIGAELLGGFGKAHQLQGASGLGAHGDRGGTRHLVDHHRGDPAALLEGHGREIACRAAGEKGRVAAAKAVVDQEAHVAAQGPFVDRQAGRVGERCRDGDVTATQPLPQPLRIHRPRSLD